MANLEPGSEFAGYRVLDQLGAGGMGQVYLVEHPHLLRREALKVISVAGVGDTDFHQRFTNEARTVAMLNHPGIVSIHHYGIDDDSPWFTMTYLDGTDLNDVLLTDGEIALVAQRSAEALDYAHRHQVIHRDVKPGNIMITREADGTIDQVVLLDFGIAKLADATSVTATSVFVGTLTYGAPELIDGRPASPASDQYALACSMYKLLTGQPPFQGETTTALMAAVLSRPAPPVSSLRPDLAALDPVFERALNKDPQKRYPDCQAFAAALNAALGGPVSGGGLSPAQLHGPTEKVTTNRPGASRRRTVLFGALSVALVAILVGAIAFFATRSDDAGPSAPPAADTFTAISTNGDTTCVIKARELYCWGGNQYGQVGDGTTDARRTPVKVAGLKDVTSVSVGIFSTCAVAEAKAYCWGELTKTPLVPTPVPGLENVTDIAADSSFCAIADSYLYCWGMNSDGQLGDGTTSSRTSPTKLETLSSVTDVAMSYGTTCAIASTTAYCWGLNSAGRLGDGTTKDRNTPVEVTGLTYPASIVTGGSSSGNGATCAVRMDRELYCWGSNQFGSVGDGSDKNQPRPVPVLADVKSVAVGGYAVCAVMLDQKVQCWGDTISGSVPKPAPVASLKNATELAISSSGSRTCAIADGKVFCWGLNESGELGDGTTEMRSTPVEVKF
ncbi:protein kinase domain-containing protein [Gordonia sp. VNK21]|uniref:protein kinase domain-containing protein n=1 Tax=Gordonia sp. VNK21 TaxID=3382483 RepID=UPI0038D4D1B9